MELWLTEEQARELESALSVHLSRMEVELIRTDDREFRAALRQSLERLEEIRRLLQQRLGDSTTYA